MLSSHESVLVAVIGAAFFLIVTGRIPIELTALLALLALAFSGLVTSEQALSGFSSSVVITLIGLFVITKALEETGVIWRIAEKLNSVGKGSEVGLITLFMATGAGLSLIMNNVAAGAVLLPAAVRVARISGVRASKLLLPVSFGTLVGGMTTYLTTANIVMSTLLHERGLEGLGMLDFIPTGGLIVLAGLVYMALIGRRLLPDRESITTTVIPTDLQQTYHLDERMWEVRVLPQSRLANRPLRESEIGETLGLTVLAIWHGRQTTFSPEPEHLVQPGDYLLVLGRKERVDELLKWGTSLHDDDAAQNHMQEFHIDLVEMIIPPRSTAIDQTLTQLALRERFGVTVVALWRGGRSYRTDVGKMTLQVGDAMLVVGQPERLKRLAEDRRFLFFTQDFPTISLRSWRPLITVLITAIVLTIAILDLLSLPLVMLAGAVAMVLTGCLQMQDFYQAVEWKVIFVVAGMLPLSIAVAETGLADRIGSALVNALAGYGPLVMVAGMFSLTVLVTQIIGGQVSALLVGPIAINTALQMQISPQAMAVAVAIACSTAFLTPVAHPVNMLMMGPGSYRSSDFFKVGVGMTIVVLLALTAGMALLWGIR
jgi:di/tricarboxylate transporter